ncbi:MAG TPA: glycoside hydrolase 100 family protein [Kofleriaceae bacterium]|jgi:glycogen debranching enzyme
MMSWDRARASAWEVVRACGESGVLVAAAGSRLYPHVWTRDVGLAALGIASRGAPPDAIGTLLRSLEILARHQKELGRMPLKVDAAADAAVSENSAGIDSGPWFTLAVFALARAAGRDAIAHLIDPARRAMIHTAHLDLDGCGLIVSPEAGDWADMLPHRHHVLYSNALHVAALRALALLVDEPAEAALLAERARRSAGRIDLLFGLDGATSGSAAGDRLAVLAAASPEWGISGQYATRWGDLPFYLPYVAFRAAGSHFDLVGNSIAILAGVAPPARAERILRHADQVAIAVPAPSRTLDPPIYPGEEDWRDHFRWRNLCVPHQYQNGGAWPFAGALHAAALVAAGRREDARALVDQLAAVCLDEAAPFPEWLHGTSGTSMGEVRQLWSAAGLLYAIECVESGSTGVFAELAA